MEQEQDTSGPRIALNCKGAQDQYMKELPGLFDMQKCILANSDHHTLYQKIEATLNYKQNKQDPYTTLSLTKGPYDMVNQLDLVIDNPDGTLAIHALIKKIIVEIGGQRIDQFYAADLETQINTTAALTNREPIRHVLGKTFVPLAMAPFHRNNLVFAKPKNHDVQIMVYWTDAASDGGKAPEVELYGHAFYLAEISKHVHEFMTVQNQCVDTYTLKKGINVLDNRYFNHPLYLIYFWGFDKTKVKRVRYLINKQVYYDGSLAALEHLKTVYGFGHVVPTILFFSPDRLGQATSSSINFSRIDYAELEIETDQDDEPTVHLVGLNAHPLRYVCGMYGLAFSK